jgi:porin
VLATQWLSMASSPTFRLLIFIRGVGSGGAQQSYFNGGKIDYNFTILGGKLGLHEGFTAFMHAETRYGQDANRAAGALALPNANMLFPLPGQDVTSITGLFVMQTLSEQWALTAGKYNSLDLFSMLYPTSGRGIDGFMNTSLLLPLGLLRTTNLSFNGGGVLKVDGQQINSALLVYDTNNSSTITGLGNLFDQGSVVLGYHRIPTESGSHGFLANWSSRTYGSTDPLSWTVIPGQGVVAGQEKGSWSAVYFLDHQVWEDRCNDARNIRLFSTWSIADEDTSPYRWTGTVALQGTGLIRGRVSDTTGVGYFYDGLGSQFKSLVNVLPTVQIQDIQGVEAYYNAAVTPWFHLTLDFQAVDNQNVSNDIAYILGLRANIKL